jgi:sulfonate transport system substrate-binding protein
MTRTKTPALLGALALTVALALTGCVAGEGSQQSAATTPKPATSGEKLGANGWSATTLNIDYATYNPLSLIVKQQGYLEKAFGDKVTVNWVKSAGSAPANAALLAGAIDVGSTAGSAALLARSNKSPIKTIDIYAQPDWSAIIVGKDSKITSPKQLEGKHIAALKGTDPYFFLLQTLEKFKVPLDKVTIDNLPHADGKSALENGSVDAWSGLDPLLTTSVLTAGSKNIYDNPSFNTYGFLNAREDFLQKSPDLAQAVVDAYEKARAYAEKHPTETAQILAEAAGIDQKVATATMKRTKLDVDPVPGDDQTKVLKVVGPIFVQSGDVPNQAAIDTALASLLDPTFAKKADPAELPNQ